MNNSHKSPMLGLKAKLFLLVFIGFSLLLAATSWRIGVIANKVASQTIGQTLKQSNVSLSAKLNSRFDDITETAKNFARDGRLLPLVYESDSITLQDLSLEFEKSLDFDSLLFTNDIGEIIARSDRPKAIGRVIAGRSALFDNALSGDVSHGITVSQGKILQIVAVPILDNFAKDIVRGTVALSYELSPKIADEIHELTQSEIGFYLFLRDKKRQIIGVKSTYNSNNDLAGKLDNYFLQNPNTWENIVDAKGMLDNISLELGDETFFAVLKPLAKNGGGNLGFIIALRSKTELMAPYRKIQYQLLLVGVICLFISSLIAAFIASKISKPIIELVSVSERIEQGDYPDTSNKKIVSDEVGILQRAIYQMGKHLKDKAELENYLADLSTSLDDDSLILDAQGLEINLSLDDLSAAANTAIDQTQITDQSIDSGIGLRDDTFDVKNIQDTLHNSPVIKVPFSQDNDETVVDVMTPNGNGDQVTINDASAQTVINDSLLERQEKLSRGTVINNRYVISSMIGSGAMADVYLANDTDLQELIAIKLISNSAMKTTGTKQLKEEIRLARKITHRNILRTFDFGQYASHFYITMEFVHGFSLESLISQRGKLDIHIGIIMAKQIALAVDAAHEQGIIHRDLKPGNMMINKQGIIKIMDFGLAKVLENGVVTEKKVSGTPRFMAPEQFTGADLDQRTDIYAIGVILYTIFTGHSPYQADDFNAWANAHMNDEIPFCRTLIPRMPAELDSIIHKALQKKPDDRYLNIKAMLLDLESLTV